MTDIPKIAPYNTKSICICPLCKGTGIGKQYEVTNYHDYYEEQWNVLCQKCDGEGRLLEYTLTYRVDLIGLEGETLTHTTERKAYKKLNGMTTSDVYKIGKHK